MQRLETGQRKTLWKGGTYGDACWKDSNSSDYLLTLKTNMNPVIISPNYTGYILGEEITISGYVEDDCEPIVFSIIRLMPM